MGGVLYGTKKICKNSAVFQVKKGISFVGAKKSGKPTRIGCLQREKSDKESSHFVGKFPHAKV